MTTNHHCNGDHKPTELEDQASKQATNQPQYHTNQPIITQIKTDQYSAERRIMKRFLLLWLHAVLLMVTLFAVSFSTFYVMTLAVLHPTLLREMVATTTVVTVVPPSLVSSSFWSSSSSSFSSSSWYVLPSRTSHLRTSRRHHFSSSRRRNRFLRGSTTMQQQQQQQPSSSSLSLVNLPFSVPDQDEPPNQEYTVWEDRSVAAATTTTIALPWQELRMNG